MSLPRLFLCGDAKLPKSDPLRNGRYVVPLTTHGSKANVNLRLQDLAKVFEKHLNSRLEDLLEIAAYVYAADCATVRTGNCQWTDDGATEPWLRNHAFVIPVFDHDFWCRPDVGELLNDVLGFLADDTYEFVFQQRTKQRKQQILEFGENEDWPFTHPDRVIMFSGGLDSLAGAVETAAKGENLVLVSHRPVTHQYSRQSKLFDALGKAFPKVAMIHVPVWVNKEEKKNREHSQRTRSFLFSALGAVVAASVQADGIRFFENGVVSLNFPVADEVLGARASRTTHPQALHWFSELYSLVLNRPVAVDNPFLFKTKTEVLSVIRDHGQSELIGLTCSCAHQGMFQSKTQLHCGTCSQCIDRRIAILAAELEAHENDYDYKVDVLAGSRDGIYPRNMAVNYARHAIELYKMNLDEIGTRFNMELARAVKPFEKQADAARKLCEMHERHAQAVHRVLTQQINDHSANILDGSLPANSMLGLMMSQQHLVSCWKNFSSRIVAILSKGVPPICQNQKPNNELRFQEICDGLLKSNDIDLIREFPFLRWGSNLTKPDWSAENLRLWVEAKYVRKNQGLLKINEAIAADITKYGDNQRRVLFVVYDPERLIIDEAVFRQPFLSRPEMEVFILR